MLNLKTGKKAVGAVEYFPSNKIPEDFLPADGQDVKQGDHPELFAVLGTMYGPVTTVSGEPYFRLPTINGRYLNGSTIREAAFMRADPSADFSVVAESLKGHNHSATVQEAGAHTHTADPEDILTRGTNTALRRNADGSIPQAYDTGTQQVIHTLVHGHSASASGAPVGVTSGKVSPVRISMVACIYAGRVV